MAATHSANGKPKARAKRSPTKTRANRNASAATPRLSRAESNRLNAQKSTGPRTEAGKAKSRYNALKHGMTALSSLLPGENAAEFEARRRRLHDDLSPRNGLEAIAIDKIAQHDWLAIRADRAAAEWSSHRHRHQPLEQEQAEREHAIELGQRLLDDLENAKPLWSGAGPGGPAHPARIVLNLEKSIPGCDWLLRRLRQLESHIHSPGLWTVFDGFELVRLLGHHLGEVITEYSIAYVLLASHYVADESKSRSGAELMAKATSHPVPRSWITSAKEDAAELAWLKHERREAEAAGEFDPRVQAIKHVILSSKQSEFELSRLPLERLLPAGVDDARRRLAEVIELEQTRLVQICARARRSPRPTPPVPPSGWRPIPAQRASASAATCWRATGCGSNLSIRS